MSYASCVVAQCEKSSAHGLSFYILSRQIQEKSGLQNVWKLTQTHATTRKIAKSVTIAIDELWEN